MRASKLGAGLALAVLANLAGGAARADLACRFETECFAGEGCGESGFALEVVDGDPAVLSTEFGDLPVLAVTGGGARLAEGAGMSVLLSRDPDGAARASVHMEGMAITYLGTCEGED